MHIIQVKIDTKVKILTSILNDFLGWQKKEEDKFILFLNENKGILTDGQVTFDKQCINSNHNTKLHTSTVTKTSVTVTTAMTTLTANNPVMINSYYCQNQAKARIKSFPPPLLSTRTA